MKPVRAPNFLPSRRLSFRWLVAVALAVFYFALLGVALFGIIHLSLLHPAFLPAVVILIFLVAPLESLLLAPLYGLQGRFHYFSALLLVTKGEGGCITLHVGTLFDYAAFFCWRDRGATASRIAVGELLRGLLAMLDELSASEMDSSCEVVAASYFFSDRTLDRLGFRLRPAPPITVLNLLMAWLGVGLRLSFVRGRLALPRLANTREAYTTLAELRTRRSAIEALLIRVEGRCSDAARL